jgi:hypothetical protein
MLLIVKILYSLQSPEVSLQYCYKELEQQYILASTTECSFEQKDEIKSQHQTLIDNNNKINYR